MRIKIYIIVMIFLAAMNIRSYAQSESSIRWSMSAKMIGNDEGIVTVKCKISDGWHVYGFNMPKNGPIPTSIDLSSSTGIQFTSSLMPEYDAIKDGENCYWDKDIKFSRKFKKTEGKQAIKAEIRYMACNGTMCMPPKTIKLEVNQIRKSK